jgi:endonuclease/exonuclease/phosphatase family metal-dependent hydrolase
MESNFAAMVNRAAIYDALKTGQPVNPEDELAVLRLDPDGDMNAASRYSVNSNPVSSALYLKGGPKVYVYASALALQDTPESATTLDKDNPNGLIIPTNTVGGDFISRSGTDEKDASESAPPLGKKNPNDLRILTYNVEGNFISHSGTDDALNRILSFLAPDILVLQEFQHNMVPNVAERLKNILGSDWHIFGGLHSGLYQNIIASRYPLAMTTQDTIPPSDTRGVTAALIDLPEPRFTKDIYVMGLHLQCCDSPVFQKQRQRSADAVISWLDDAKKDGGEITLVPGTPVVVLGDLNLVDDTQPGVTLQTGDIFDEMTFGPDRKPDWDGSYLTDVKPKDPFTGNSNTSHSKDEQPAIRYDRIFFTNSVATVARSFVLNTLNFDEDSLASAGLKKEDTATCSDHLPVVIDLRLL